ncbi:hypothetical protein PtA15_2A473 [Puccinia triticina]|uniref:Uncharacterized protein n=1 Tax=Puccinia triticina TaxID=208348 RepID=A0ABY7CB72_9BASI|nr:uncharacterized protein PtA15_2A473 [Puccinia triticina]WAQ82158.1 hypothetical protein PtA15_2A473 [Puccinia triticina]
MLTDSSSSLERALQSGPILHYFPKERVKLGNTDSPSDSPSPSVSPAKQTFIQMTPEAGGSDSKGKQKASPKEFLEEEHGVEDEPQSEPAEEEDDDNCPKTGRGRPRKAILKDAAKRLKKL